MNKDYYQTLGLKRDASSEEIASNFKKLALRWNPKKAPEDYQTASYHFSEVAEAYDVLSDPIKRSFYDKYGWQKFKEGFYADGQLKGGYRFPNNPDEIFNKFFSSNQSFAKVFDKNISVENSLFSHAFGALNYQDKNVMEDLLLKIPCTLPELYKGTSKMIKYERKVLNLDGRSTSLREQEKLIEIKPGYGKGTILRLKEQGHENVNRKKSDLVLVIKEIPEPNFSRMGQNLLYTTRITLAQAIDCQPIFITTLDGSSLRIGLDEIPNPRALKEVENQGMPILNQNRRGNLYIKFIIEFPATLKEEAKVQLRKMLK